MTFFKNDMPEQIAQLRERVAKLEAAIERIDRESIDMESDLRGRIEDVRKLTRGGSLQKEQEKDEKEGLVMPGYTPWSQRKQERKREHSDPQFSQRVARRGRKPASGETQAAGS